MRFLCIETATTVCSVSLFENEQLLAFREVNDGFTHAENLHLFIEAVLMEVNWPATHLQAIAVSIGPGSYTGLRIGVSAAKGMAYALQIPVIGIDTLQIIAAGAKSLQAADFYVPMIDARRMEVFTAVYDSGLNLIKPVEALIVDNTSITRFEQYSGISFCGDGMPKCKTLLEELPVLSYFTEALPSARFMATLALKRYHAGEFEDLAYFEPRYLKEFQAGKKKQTS